jgi:hypothetical protein
MRWYEVIKESANDLTELARKSVLDILTPLMSMGISSITIKQVIDQLKTIPEFQGMNLTKEYIIDLMDNFDGFTIEPNDKGVMSIKINDNTKLHHSDKSQKDKSKEEVTKKATKVAKQDMKGK